MTDQPSPGVPPKAAPSPALPDRKVIAGAIGGFLAWALFAAVSSYAHIDLADWAQPYVTMIFTALGVVPVPSAQGLLAVIAGNVIAYYTPPSAWDIIKHLSDERVELAQQLKAASPPPSPPAAQ